MYMYFFLMAFPAAAKVAKTVAPAITVIQVTQMVWGLIVNGIAVFTYFGTGACQIQSVTVYSAIVMYASYFYLFSQLFFESRACAKKSKHGLARTLSRKISEAVLCGLEDDAVRHVKAN